MKKWWGIRHVRWYFLSVEFNLWWFRFGRHYWVVPNEADLEYLERVRRGEA